jgi:hypothetical protein
MNTEVLTMQEQLLNHEERLTTLEKNYSNLVGEITSVKNGQLQLENTVLRTSQDQSGLLNTLITNSFDLKKTKAVSRKEIIIAGIGSGGVLGIVVGSILKFM